MRKGSRSWRSERQARRATGRTRPPGAAIPSPARRYGHGHHRRHPDGLRLPDCFRMDPAGLGTDRHRYRRIAHVHGQHPDRGRRHCHAQGHRRTRRFAPLAAPAGTTITHKFGTDYNRYAGIEALGTVERTCTIGRVRDSTGTLNWDSDFEWLYGFLEAEYTDLNINSVELTARHHCKIRLENCTAPAPGSSGFTTSRPPVTRASSS